MAVDEPQRVPGRDVMADGTTPLLSIVVPCYNEEEVITATLERMFGFCDTLSGLDVDVICIGDGSGGRTRELLKACAGHDPRLRVIGFACNFGHQIALTAGMDAAAGDAVG